MESSTFFVLSLQEIILIISAILSTSVGFTWWIFSNLSVLKSKISLIETEMSIYEKNNNKHIFMMNEVIKELKTDITTSNLKLKEEILENIKTISRENNNEHNAMNQSIRDTAKLIQSLQEAQRQIDLKISTHIAAHDGLKK